MKRVIYQQEARMLDESDPGRSSEEDLCPECRGQLWHGYYHPEGGYFFLFPPGEELIPRGTLPARGCHRCLRVAPPPQGGREGTSGGLKG